MHSINLIASLLFFWKGKHLSTQFTSENWETLPCLTLLLLAKLAAMPLFLHFSPVRLLPPPHWHCHLPITRAANTWDSSIQTSKRVKLVGHILHPVTPRKNLIHPWKEQPSLSPKLWHSHHMKDKKVPISIQHYVSKSPLSRNWCMWRLIVLCSQVADISPLRRTCGDFRPSFRLTLQHQLTLVPTW